MAAGLCGMGHKPLSTCAHACVCARARAHTHTHAHTQENSLVIDPNKFLETHPMSYLTNEFEVIIFKMSN